MRLDSRTEEILTHCHPRLAGLMRNVYQEMYMKTGVEMRATEGVRSFQRQRELYKSGKGVTCADAGHSFHNYGLAIDSCFAGDDPYLEKNPRGEYLWTTFGHTVEIFGLSWGGRFKILDCPHAELSMFLTTSDCKKILESGSIQSVWQAVDLNLQRNSHDWIGDSISETKFKPLDPRV